MMAVGTRKKARRARFQKGDNSESRVAELFLQGQHLCDLMALVFERKDYYDAIMQGNAKCGNIIASLSACTRLQSKAAKVMVYKICVRGMLLSSQDETLATAVETWLATA